MARVVKVENFVKSLEATIGFLKDNEKSIEDIEKNLSARVKDYKNLEINKLGWYDANISLIEKLKKEN